MIVRMLPEQASLQWETLKPAIESAVPEEFMCEEYMTNVLKAIVKGDMHCWLLVEGKDVAAMGITSFLDDPGGGKSLFIFALYSYMPVSLEKWADAFNMLKRWAAVHGCGSVLAYTDSGNEAILRIARSVGGDVSRTLVTLPVGSNGGI